VRQQPELNNCPNVTMKPCSVEEKAAKEAAKAQRKAALEAKKAAKQKNTLLNHFAIAKTVSSPACTPTVLQSNVHCTVRQGETGV